MTTHVSSKSSLLMVGLGAVGLTLALSLYSYHRVRATDLSLQVVHAELRELSAVVAEQGRRLQSATARAEAAGERFANEYSLLREQLRRHDEMVMKARSDEEIAALYAEAARLRAGLPPDVLAAITRDYSAAWAERRAQNARRQALLDRGWAPGVFHKDFMERMKKLSGGKNAVVVPPGEPVPTTKPATPK